MNSNKMNLKLSLIDIGSEGKSTYCLEKILNKHNLNNKIFGIEYDMTLTDIAIKKS